MSECLSMIINGKEYNIKEAKTQEELKQGLKGVKNLPDNEGMLFYIDPPRKGVVFTMEDCEIPLDIIFINEDQEVVQVILAQPNQKNITCEEEVAYVLELNINSGVKEGLEIDLDNEGPVMKVLFPDGSTQMELWGGERIISRRETKVLIKKAKKAQQTSIDSDYKALGKYLFKVFLKLDNRDPEYVNLHS